MASRLRLRRPRLGALALLAAAALALALAAGGGARAHEVAACAFLRTPHTYEAAAADRLAYLEAIDAAAADALFPGDPYFGLPDIETGVRGNRSPSSGLRQVPAALLRAIGWIESNLAMAATSVPFEGEGEALVSFDCGHGIMQITTGMTVPLGLDYRPSPDQISIATHYAHNIARGAWIFADKWNAAPERRPIAGTDTGGAPGLLENWYFAVWSYNGWSGPGDNYSNHPSDPIYGWPRAPYLCDGSQSYNRFPYQELVWGCLASPPSVGGRALWEPIAAALPDLGDPRYFHPLSLANWYYPYHGMDMPTPQPHNEAIAPDVPASRRASVLAAPAIGVAAPPIVLRTDGSPSEARAEIEIRNRGSGILSWAAESSDSWIVVDPPAGVALGPGVPCNPPACERAATLTVTVNPTLLPAASARGVLRIVSPNASGPAAEVRIQVEADFIVDAPGASRAY